MSLNRVMLIGNCGRDAELRYTADGNAMAQVSVAVNSRRRNAAGETVDEAEWFNVVLWGDLAERLAQYLTKGKEVFVEGRLQTRTWNDDAGERRYRTEVIASNVQLLGGRPDGEQRRSREGYTGNDDDLPYE